MPAHKQRKVIVHIAASADGYIAGPDDDLEWLTSRPDPKGFYGIPAFMKTIDTMVMGRKTYEVSLGLGAKYDAKTPTFVFSRRAPPSNLPPGVAFVREAVGPFMKRLRAERGKHVWLMGGGEIIAAFLDAQAIDEFVVTVIPVFIGDGTPLIARRPRHVRLTLKSAKPFPDGVVQVHYKVEKERARSSGRG